MKKRNHALAALGLSALAGIFAASTVPALSGCDGEYCSDLSGVADYPYSNKRVAEWKRTKRCVSDLGPIPTSDSSGCPESDSEMQDLNQMFCGCQGGIFSEGSCSRGGNPLLLRPGAELPDSDAVPVGFCRYEYRVRTCER
jgi:hypothetical protein